MTSHEPQGLRTEHSGSVVTQSSVLSPQSFEVHIEELVLHGFAPGDSHRIGEAVERELARLLAERGTLPWQTRDGHIPDLNAGSFQVVPGANARTIGAQVARAVYSRIAPILPPS